MAHLVRPVPVGVWDRVTGYRHLSTACSFGKWPRARTARRERALSMAFVEQITLRISVS
jgi:hypothetical protein